MSVTLHLGGSRLYLGTGNIADRLRANGGVDVTISGECDAPEPGAAAIRYFTIPNHLYERLWLEEIPRLTGAAEPANTEQGDAQWKTVDSLTMAMQLVDEGFRKPIEAVFHAMPHAPGETGDDIAVAAGSGGNGGNAHWTRCAWLNIDDHNHAFRAALKEEAEASAKDADYAEFTIEPGEGIVWRRDRLIVTDGPGHEPGRVQTKLLLLAG